MEQYIPTFTDITEWSIQIYSNTGGTRSKKIAIHPQTHEEYFFKASKELKDGEIRYHLEFWSEIVSSKVGQMLGFNMLDYNIAYKQNDKQPIGCISQSMVRATESKLTEGKDYLVGFNPHYDPENDKTDYTFQFICNTLKFFKFEAAIPNILNLIVFDAIVGNSDRHQENWGFITNFKETIEVLDTEISQKDNPWVLKMILKLFKWGIVKHINIESNNKLILLNQSNLAKNRFSPIYDSGCCLGRELTDYSIEKMLNDPLMLNSYIKKGASEIHWQGLRKKQNHFELIKLLQYDYHSQIHKIIEQVKKGYKQESIRDIITNIDRNLPQELLMFKLPDNRKELMIKIISLRIQQLLEIQ